ncbi:early nodulin-like protein [Musa troglodytarum]|uniref:Early nodulin-like protein n=1 Tax=Musa troglodytarum TaxID=320322 RepID=A0A9E7GZB6_9LILI|nr:early nodulin-like protein [Musa troglodytarum]
MTCPNKSTRPLISNGYSLFVFRLCVAPELLDQLPNQAIKPIPLLGVTHVSIIARLPHPSPRKLHYLGSKRLLGRWRRPGLESPTHPRRLAQPVGREESVPSRRLPRSSPVAEHRDGATAVELHRSGAYYFISGAEGACEQGEKLIVVVMSERHSLRGGLAPARGPTEFEGPAVAPTSGASTTVVLKSGVAAALLVLGMTL